MKTNIAVGQYYKLYKEDVHDIIKMSYFITTNKPWKPHTVYYKVVEKQSQGRWGIIAIFDDLDFKPHKTTSLIFVDWRQLKEGPYKLVQDEKIKTMLVLYG